MTQKKNSKSETISTSIKSKLLERIVAIMHNKPGVKIERNVHLPVKQITPGKRQRRREIDILITSSVVGYPIRIAIECKNYKNPIGSPKIDAFIGKLDDVGIPSQQGIFVSSTRFTTGAIERAKKAGIRTLILKGLTKDRLSSSIYTAFQSIIYLLPNILSIKVVNNVPQSANSEQMLAFHDNNGKICGVVPDLIWKKWKEGYPPSTIGEFKCDLDIPQNWHQVIDGKIVQVISITAKLNILGLVVMIEGKAKQHLLIDAEKNKIEKIRGDIYFDTSKLRHPLRIFTTESQLEEFLKNRPEKIKLSIGRIRLPRIVLGPIYWPPSQRVGEILTNLYQTGKMFNMNVHDLSKIAEEDLDTVWEGIWEKYPPAN